MKLTYSEHCYLSKSTDLPTLYMESFRSLYYRGIIDFSFEGKDRKNVSYTLSRGENFSTDNITTRVDKFLVYSLMESNEVRLIEVLGKCAELAHQDMSALSSYFNRDLRDKKFLNYFGFKTLKGKKKLNYIRFKIGAFKTKLNSQTSFDLETELTNLGEMQLFFYRDLLQADLLKTKSVSLLLCRHEIYRFSKLQQLISDQMAREYDALDDDFDFYD
ncbi:MAG: hypothetical protein ACI9J3_001722 [Parvicellaceae bacterium]|jgi:hypothetical protein